MISVCSFTCAFVGALTLIVVVLIWKRKSPTKKGRVCVVVLGDIGRSPRMQYHSLSLAREGFHVDIIGYGGSVPHADVVECEAITFHHMMEPPSIVQKLPRLLVYVTKVLWQCFTLVLAFLLSKAPGTILLQNPPAIPTLAVCWVMSVLQGSHLVVDWHNYGYTILSLAVGSSNPLVKFARWYEGFFGKKSESNICVTKSMSEDLKERWNIQASVMYDRPPDMFCETSLFDQHILFMKLADTYPVFASREESQSKTDRTLLTERTQGGEIVKVKDRPALLISSTSWTEDEDFSVLLSALEKYESSKQRGEKLPDLLCVITGKGPQKAYYMDLISQKSWQHVTVCTPWLEAEDYPKLLGSGDVGVCLHTSSSGLDLPMKVVDMYGCGLPVCAIYYKCLNELVIDGETGLVFQTEDMLASQLQDLLKGFPNNTKKLQNMRENLCVFQNVRWHQTWTQNVLPIIKREKS